MGKMEGFDNKHKKVCHDVWVKDKVDRRTLDVWEPEKFYVLLSFCWDFFQFQEPLHFSLHWGSEAWLVRPWECLKISREVPRGHLRTSRLQPPVHCSVTTEVRKANEQASMVKTFWKKYVTKTYYEYVLWLGATLAQVKSLQDFLWHF